MPCGEEMCGEHEHCEDDKCMCGEHECEEGHECEENHEGEKECTGNSNFFIILI